MEKAKYIINSNKEYADKILKSLDKIKEKTGYKYCPCVPPTVRNEDTICPCKEYREHGGKCHCNLYSE